MERSRPYTNLRLAFFRTQNPSPEQLQELRNVLEALPIEVSLEGLNFARRRWLREQYKGGALGGRPSKVSQETRSLTPEEARERLSSWKWWIRFYREKGYGRTTTSRIKKELIRRSQQTA